MRANCHRDCHRTGEYRPILDRKTRRVGAEKPNITGQNTTERDENKQVNGDFKPGALNYSATLPVIGARCAPGVYFSHGAAGG
jgi:hypothetical protein